MTNVFKGLEENDKQTISMTRDSVVFYYNEFCIRVKYVINRNQILMLFNDKLDTWCSDFDEMMFWVKKRLPDEFYNKVNGNYLKVIESVLMDFWCCHRDAVEHKDLNRFTTVIDPKVVINNILSGSTENTYLMTEKPSSLAIQEYEALLEKMFDTMFGFIPETISIEWANNMVTFKTSLITELIERNRIDL